MTFGELLKKARLENNWSQRDLSEKMKEAGTPLDYSYISRLENNSPDYPLSEEKIEVLAKVLNVDPVKLTIAAGKLPSDLPELAKQNEEEFLTFYRKLQK